MKSAWFEHVRDTRKKMQRKSNKTKEKKQISHREAMTSASITWSKKKQQIVRKEKRLAKKKIKSGIDQPAQPLVLSES